MHQLESVYCIRPSDSIMQVVGVFWVSISDKFDSMAHVHMLFCRHYVCKSVSSCEESQHV